MGKPHTGTGPARLAGPTRKSWTISPESGGTAMGKPHTGARSRSARGTYSTIPIPTLTRVDHHARRSGSTPIRRADPERAGPVGRSADRAGARRFSRRAGGSLGIQRLAHAHHRQAVGRTVCPVRGNAGPVSGRPESAEKKPPLSAPERRGPPGGRAADGGRAGAIRGGRGALVEAGFDTIDINFGCPVKKVLGRCRGGYHLGQPQVALEIVRRTREAVPAEIPVTLKMRCGIDTAPKAATISTRSWTVPWPRAWRPSPCTAAPSNSATWARATGLCWARSSGMSATIPFWAAETCSPLKTAWT